VAARREQGVWVNASDERATIIVNADGTPVSAGGGGGTSIVDDAAFVVGVSSLTPVGGLVSADTVDAGDIGVFAMLANRQQKVSLYNSSGVEITSFGGGTEYVVNAVVPADPTGSTFVMERDDSLSALTEVEGDWTQPRSNANGALWIAIDGGLPAGANNIGDVDVVTMPSDPFGANADAASATGSISAKLRFIASTGIPVTGTVTVGSHAVTNAGTFPVQVDGAALTSLQLIDDTVYAEDVAAQASDKGIAILAVRRDADTSLVNSDNDYANLQVNAAGSLKVAITAGAGSGGTSIADEAAFTIGSTSLTPIGGQYNSTVDSLADGSAGIAHMTVKRALHVSIRDATTGAEVSVGGGTQYDEDTASADAQKLTMAGVTRADTAATQVNTDGDRSTLIVDASGRLHVNVGNTVTVGTHAVTNAAGAFVVQENGAALTALQLIDDIVYTDDTSTHATGTSKGALIMAAAVPTDTSVNANDIAAVAMTTDRKLHVAVMDALPAGSAAIGKLAANAGVTIGAVEIAAAQTLATVTTVSTVTAMTTLTGSGIAHDGADSGNPHKVGGRAISAEIAAVANNDRSDFVTDLVGKQIIMPYANPENFVSGAITSAMTGTTSTSLLAAPASGLRNYITQITISNAHATVGTDVVIQDGSGGTTLYTIPAAAVYGGATLHFPVPLRQPTTATAIYCANVTTGASTKVSASGYKGA
jgi:hypothetical protein